MKKHVIGFAVFSFIVGLSAIIYTFYNIPQIPEVPAPNYSYRNYEAPARNGKINETSPVVRQAVLNLNTKQINLDLLLNNDAAADGRIPLKLNFFRKDAGGTRFIGSENVTLVSASYQYEGEKVGAEITASYLWLDNLNSYDNLYVVAEAVSEYDYSRKTPVFDSRFAKAVTLFSENKTFLRR